MGEQVTWFPLEREPSVRQVRAALDGRQAVVILTGESGVGKSALARQVVDELGASGLAVFGQSDLSALSLAALAGVLRLQPGTAVADRYATAVAALSATGARTIVVDDAHWVDDLTAAVLHQVNRGEGTRLLATVRSGARLPTALDRLREEGSCTELMLTGFTPEEIDRQMQAVCGGPVDPGTLDRLHRRSGGNPLVLRELVGHAARTGGITRRAGGIHVVVATPPDRLVDVLRRRLRDVDPDLLSDAAVVSWAEPVPVAAVPAVEQLVEADLVRVADGQVRAAHPAVREAAATFLTPERVRSTQLAAAALLGDDNPIDLVRRTRLLLRAGAEVPVEDLLAGAEKALALGDLETAAQLAGAVRPAEEDTAREVRARSELALGVAASAGDSDEAERHFAAAADTAEPLLRARVAVQHAHHLGIRRGDPTAAAQILAAAAADGGDRGVLDAERVKWAAMAGGRLHAPPAPPDDAGPTAALVGLLMTAMVHTMDGRTDAARGTVAAARPLVDDQITQIPHAADLLDLDEFLITIGEGRLAEAADFADERIDPARPQSVGLWTHVLALHRLHTGRSAQARLLAERSQRALRWYDFTGLGGAAAALTATVHARCGEILRAEAELGALTADGYGDVKVVMQAAQARAWLLHGRGRVDQAAEVLAEAAAVGVERGHSLLAALTAFTAVVQGRPRPVLTVLDAAAAAGESILVRTHLEQAVAMVDKDPVALEAIGERYLSGGHLLGVLTAWSSAADLFDRSSRSERARRVRVRLDGIDGISNLDGRRGSTLLTVRELEVARLAASRARSREIAEQLGISVRTVQNQLGAAYRKLGISSRDELGPVLGQSGLLQGQPTHPPISVVQS